MAGQAFDLRIEILKTKRNGQVRFALAQQGCHVFAISLLKAALDDEVHGHGTVVAKARREYGHDAQFGPYSLDFGLILSAQRLSGKISTAEQLMMQDSNVISFRVVRSRRQQRYPVQPPTVLTSPIPASSQVSPGEDVEDRLRMRQNIAALLVITCIVVLGTWLMDSLHSYSRVQMCIEAGHRNCVPVDHKFQPSPYATQRGSY